LFHDNRWDYVFTLKRQGLPQQRRQLTVFFNGENMERVEGDAMPSEAEFVATLDRRGKGGKVPPLVATEEQLRAISTKTPAAAAAAAAPPPAAPATTVNYPPLEAPAR
jgi:outer membrane protein assembly factor BamE